MTMSPKKTNYYQTFLSYSLCTWLKHFISKLANNIRYKRRLCICKKWHGSNQSSTVEKDHILEEDKIRFQDQFCEVQFINIFIQFE